MRLLLPLVASLILSLAPSVSAGVCVGGSCADASSQSAGSCADSGYARNDVLVSASLPQSGALVHAGTFCYEYDEHGIAGGRNKVDASAGAHAAGHAAGVALVWDGQWISPTFSYCSTQVAVGASDVGSRTEELGCPAGAPPDVPALLP